MFEYLEAFEKRMEFVAIVESIVNRKNTNSEIEGWFQNSTNKLDNLFFTLLVYIMEQTLNENEECTMDNMVTFIEQVIPAYGVKLQYGQVRLLTEYMVKDILQNKGEVKYYQVMNYETDFHAVRVRLISDRITDDKRIIYQLTDQGYDFLFRTKEIDKELNFRLEQLKLKELIKRKNYRHAVNQSRELVSMLRQKKREIEEFVFCIRRNIHEIDREQYEKILTETYALIDEEYQGMNDIKEGVEQDENRINQEKEVNGYLDNTMKSALDSLSMIKKNILEILAEQRNLIAKRFSMNDVYEETIQNSFSASIVKRYDFEEEVLNHLHTVHENSLDILNHLLVPLRLPRLSKIINLTMLYQPQGKLRESLMDDYSEEEEELLEDDSRKRVEENNYRNVLIIEKLLEYAANHASGFSFYDFFDSLKNDSRPIGYYTKDKCVFLIILKLFQESMINLELWKENKESAISEANGEFDLAWCLYQIEYHNFDFWNIKKILIYKSHEIVSFSYEDRLGEEPVLSTIEMNDLFIEVEMKKEEEVHA